MDEIPTDRQPRILQRPSSGLDGGIISGAFLMLVLIILIANSFLLYKNHQATLKNSPAVQSHSLD